MLRRRRERGLTDTGYGGLPNRGHRRPAAARLCLSHTPDGVCIRYKKVRDDICEEVEFSDIAKSYESEDGEVVILSNEELASLPAEQSHEVEVTEFVPADQVNPVAFDNAYSWSRHRGRIGRTC